MQRSVKIVLVVMGLGIVALGFATLKADAGDLVAVGRPISTVPA